MRKIVLSIAFAATTVVGMAQNRLVNKAEGLIDEGKIVEAQGLLTQALTSGETKDMAKAWNLQGDVYQRMFAGELNKAAAQQPMDTAQFCKNLYACIEAYDKCNEADAKQQYAAKNKDNLKRFRLFVYYAGVFNLQSGKQLEAFDAFDKWMQYPTAHKLVADDPQIINDSTVDKSEVAYYACLAAYQGKNYDSVDKYIQEALNYSKERKTVRQLRMMTLLEKGDTLQWEQVSKEYALEDETIAQNLLAHYSNKQDNQAALAFADELIAADPNNKIANYAKGVVLFGEKKFEEALPFFDKCVEIDPEFVDAYYNAGSCCCNVGSALNDQIGSRKYKTQADYNKDIEVVKQWYGKAEPYFSKVRELKPDEPGKWAYNLKSIYYVTGNKEKEAEMDVFLKE